MQIWRTLVGSGMGLCCSVLQMIWFGWISMHRYQLTSRGRERRVWQMLPSAIPTCHRSERLRSLPCTLHHNPLRAENKDRWVWRMCQPSYFKMCSWFLLKISPTILPEHKHEAFLLCFCIIFVKKKPFGHLGSYARALYFGQPRWQHLFVTPWPMFSKAISLFISIVLSNLNLVLGNNKRAKTTLKLLFSL